MEKEHKRIGEEFFDFNLGGYPDFEVAESGYLFGDSELDFFAGVLKDRVIDQMLKRRGVNIRAVLRYLSNEEEIMTYLGSRVLPEVIEEIAKHYDYKISRLPIAENGGVDLDKLRRFRAERL